MALILSQDTLFGLRARGKRKAFTKEILRHLLTNPMYIGKVRYQRELYDAPREASIDEDTWKAVRETLLTRRRCAGGHAETAPARSCAVLSAAASPAPACSRTGAGAGREEKEEKRITGERENQPR